MEASTEGSMLLSGVLLKVGLYGVLRCCLELCGGATLALAPYLLTLALVGALITSLSAYRQLDLKKIIAYSSVVHMNLSLMGLFCLSSTAVSGTLYLNFGHAVVSAGLFAAVGVLQDRTRTRSLLELSGLDRSMPLWSFCLLLLLLANAGMPGTVGFLGEAGMLWGCFQSFASVGLLALPAVGLMGLRNLLLYAQLCWGVAPAFMGPLVLRPSDASDASAAAAPEASLLLRHWDVAPGRDGLVLLLLTLLSLGLGIWPQPLLLLLEESSLALTSLGGVLCRIPAGTPAPCCRCWLPRSSAGGCRVSWRAWRRPSGRGAGGLPASQLFLQQLELLEEQLRSLKKPPHELLKQLDRLKDSLVEVLLERKLLQDEFKRLLDK